LNDGPCVDGMVHFVRAPVLTTVCSKDFLILSNELFQCLVPSEIQVLPGVRQSFFELFAEPLLPPTMLAAYKVGPVLSMVVLLLSIMSWFVTFITPSYIVDRDQNSVLLCTLHGTSDWVR
jgi:hypothetical protein